MWERRMITDQIDFSRLVHRGDTVIWTQGAGEPTTLVEALLAQRHAIGPFRIFLGASYSGIVKPEHADVVSFIGLGAVGSNRAMCKAGKMDIIPCHLSDVPPMLANGMMQVDVVLTQLSPKNPDGNFSFGPVNSYVQAALPQARTVIAEVNDQAPWTFARDAFDPRRIDAWMEVSRAMPEVPTKPFEAIDLAIARSIASLVPDGAALQVGIGTIPNAIFSELRSHRNLGLHTGVIGDGIVDLIERGVVDNSRKAIDRGKSVTGGLVGTRIIYDFAHMNPELLVEPVTYTHASRTLQQLERLIAINSAVEVDLTGQIGAEVAGRNYIGTVGGQVDFVRGALASPGGRSIIGLPSRTESGRSRIVAKIQSGIVTTARSDADVVVTEYGVAELRYQAIPERVRRMIAIAHPDDREQLEREAREEVVGY